MTRRRWNERQRRDLFAKWGGCCHICGGAIAKTEGWEVEHVIPLAQGGDDDDENARPAHIKCHRNKSAIDAGDTARAKRREAKHCGFRPKPLRPIRSAGFPPRKPQNRASGKIDKFAAWRQP